jgi:hypothetical protein
MIMLPEKDGIYNPLFDYELNLYDAMFTYFYRHIWVLKARGIGVTEFYLRVMAWLCLSWDGLRGSQMGIITGPNIQIAKDLIERMKKLFEPRLGITFPYASSTLILNSCRIRAFPSHTIMAFRGQAKMSFILVDEGDFFPKGQQQNVRNVVEGYIPKTHPIIAMVSTANEPGGMFEQIDKEPSVEEAERSGKPPCLYRRFRYDWRVGHEQIFTDEDIRLAKMTPLTFAREFELKYGYKTGQIFSEKIIKMIENEGLKYPVLDTDMVNPYTLKSMGIDPAMGSSKYAFVVGEILSESRTIRVLYADEFERPDYDDMKALTFDLISKYSPKHIYVDGWHWSVIEYIKKELGEPSRHENVQQIIQTARKRKAKLEDVMTVIPVPFQLEKRQILEHLKDIADTEGALAIDPNRFRNLIIDMEGAREEEGKLIKDEGATHDLLDALQMMLKYFRFDTVTY